MHRVVYSATVEKDLMEIRDYIAKDNKYYSQKVIEQILWYINGMLSTFPLMWTENKETGDRVLIEPTFEYKILYRFDGHKVTIMNVFKYRNI